MIMTKAAEVATAMTRTFEWTSFDTSCLDAVTDARGGSTEAGPRVDVVVISSIGPVMITEGDSWLIVDTEELSGRVFVAEETLLGLRPTLKGCQNKIIRWRRHIFTLSEIQN